MKHVRDINNNGKLWLRVLCAAAALIWHPVFAQEPTDGNAAPYSLPEYADMEEVHVIGVQRSPPGQLAGDELRRAARGTIGATLAETLGVANASFGAGVGLPVVRGLQGPRVHVSVNGAGSHDASNLSPDHAIPIEPLLTDSIRVRRGPSAILFGGTAIGGAVEIDDGRIPRGIPAPQPSGMAALSFDSALEESAAAAKGDFQFGAVVLHAAGFVRDRHTHKIPGFAIDEEAVRSQFGLVDIRNSLGVVENAQAQSMGGSFGASLIRDWGLAGVAVTHGDYDYGIPPGGHPSHTHGGIALSDEDGEEVRIDMRQSRADMLVQVTQLPWKLQQLEIRGALVDYEHDEEEFGIPVTSFRNDVAELGVRLDHATTRRIDTQAGLRVIDREFAAVGDEAFIPPASIDSIGGFLLTHFRAGPIEADAGWRWQKDTTRPENEDRIAGGVSVPLPPSMRYVSNSFSARVSVYPTAWSALRISAQRAQRAPEVQEMFSLGPHLATRSFNIGSLDLELETAHSLQLEFSAALQRAELQLNVFANHITGFIYQQAQGYFYDMEEQLFRVRCVQLEQCLPVLGYQQQDANFHGAELRLSVPLSRARQPGGNYELSMDVFADYTRGRFAESSAGDVPRQPAPRFGLDFEFESQKWAADLRWTYAFDQQYPGLNEAPTEGYNLVNLSAERRLRNSAGELVVHLTVRNALDAEIRNAVSFLRSFAPEPGRGVELGIRVAR